MKIEFGAFGFTMAGIIILLFVWCKLVGWSINVLF